MIEGKASREIIVPIKAECQHCGSKREIGHASPPVYIGKKKTGV